MIWPEHTLKQKDLELSLVPDIGGRLMDVRYKGVSLLFQNPDLLNRLPELNRLGELPSRATHLSFPLWGGEKTWIAPDTNWPDAAPHSVLDSGRYEFEHEHDRENTVIMKSPLCPESNFQIIRKITLNDSQHWTIRHQLINQGLTEKKAGIWSVMMTRAPASYLFPLPTGVQPSTIFGDPEEAFSSNDKVGIVHCDKRHEFKLGTHPETGLSAARIPTEKGVVWLVNTATINNNNKNYAHGHALEFYNSGHYHYGELEWHSPVATLSPGQSMEFVLSYHLYVEVEDASFHEMFKRIQKRHEVT